MLFVWKPLGSVHTMVLLRIQFSYMYMRIIDFVCIISIITQ